MGDCRKEIKASTRLIRGGRFWGGRWLRWNVEGGDFFEVRKRGERAIGNEETGDEEGEGKEEGE